MYDDLLVPTDGSEGTERTLKHALWIAKNADATVHALSVIDRRVYLAAPKEDQDGVLDTLETEAENAVDDVVAAAEERGLDTERAVRQGVPYREVLDYAGNADVVVMGTHGRTGRDRLANLGSVTERVVENVSVPVMTVQIG
jgi:nucleotide-binding universal stress UspA family protein